MKKENSKKTTIKSYAKDCWDFIEENLKRSTGIFLIISILVMALTITYILPETLAKDCAGICRDGVTIGSEMSSRIMVIVITIFAGIAPYIYAPVIGFLGGVINEVTTLSFIIKGYGYFGGILIGIVPLIINLIVICVATSLGMYVCKMITLKGKLSSLTGMNYTNFKIKLYEDMHNEVKVKELKAKQNEKIKKLNSKVKKIDYLQIFNVSIVIIVLQIISILIQEILL